MNGNSPGGHERKLADPFPIAYVALTVSNLEKSSAFYQSVLGLTVLLNTDRFAVLGSFDGRPFILLAQPERTVPSGPRAAGLDHFALLVPNRLELSRHMARIRDMNYPIAMVADHLVNESVYIRDPDGMLIEITRDLAPGELADRKPLHPDELQDQLLGLARHPHLSRLSEERKIGHILLRVSNLSEAAQYYVEHLGFQVSMRMPGAVFVSSGAYHHHLGFHVWESEGGPPPDARAIGLRHYGVFAAHDESRQESLMPTNKTPFPRFEKDPAGNGIVFIQRAHANPRDLIDLDQRFEQQIMGEGKTEWMW